MKIRKVKCEQFAGIIDREIEFKDGMNLFIGENETGKSTIADLIFYLFFGDVKLSAKSDREFLENYFPKLAGGDVCEEIDGEISFETKNGAYTLSKTWDSRRGKVGSCKLKKKGENSKTDPQQIAKILSEELGYGAGVYSELVLPSQKRQQAAVESILKELSGRRNDKLEETKGELASTLKKAVLESGGVSLDKLSEKLSEKLFSYESHWDLSAGMPEGGVKRGIENPWKKEVGLILEAYYKMETVRRAKRDTENAEREACEVQEKIRELRKERRETEERRSEFLRVSTNLKHRALLEEKLRIQAERKEKGKAVLLEWPEMEENIKRAEKLGKVLRISIFCQLFEAAEKVKAEYDACIRKREALKCVELLELKKVQELQKKRDQLEGKLSGLNLMAGIRELGEKKAEVRRALDGAPVCPEKGLYPITEAVEIFVPGVLEMQLMPQRIDLEELRTEFADAERAMETVFEKYAVPGLNELEEAYEAYRQAELLEERMAERWEQCLRDTKWLDYFSEDFSWEMAKKEYERCSGEKENREELREKIEALCGKESLEGYISGRKALLQKYEEEYGTVKGAEESVALSDIEILRTKEALEALKELPEEFERVKNPEEFELSIKLQAERLEQQIAEREDRLRETERRLGETSAEEYAEELQRKEETFEKIQKEDFHWRHIKEVFDRMKEAESGNPVEDIFEKFQEYLGLISEDGITLCSLDEKFTAVLTSRMETDGSEIEHMLTYGTLSEGTKDTISLAFRLAMLEHIFPDGDGLAVFDDPFTDMDPGRVRQACRLIERFAEKNQVIFLTCDEKYRELLHGGNLICGQP